MEEGTKISVVIPTYHRNDLLALCLDRLAPSVQTLSSDSYEVIVTDDGIKETAQAMMIEKYPWAKWVAGPRKGPAANRNNGATHAKGKWLVFLDDDCVPEADLLEEYSKAIQLNKEIYVFEGKTICKVGVKSPLMTAPVNETGGYLWSCNFCIKKDIFKEIGLFNTHFPYPNMEDVEFRERLKDNMVVFKFIETAIIDHPPRMMKFGKDLAKLHESSYYFRKVFKKTKNIEVSIISEILRTRLRDMFNTNFGNHTFIAFKSLIFELTYTLVSFHKWRKKYNSIHE